MSVDITYTQNDSYSDIVSSTIINIAHVEIAHGVIANLEDFITQLNVKVAT